MISNVIIVHGCPHRPENDPSKRTYDKHWMPWIKQKLLGLGFKVDFPIMPHPWQPEYDAFKSEFEKYFVDENTILVGHSCGCAFLVRWLGESKQKIKKLILVAPWKIPDKDDSFRMGFYTYAIDPEIRNRVKEIVMFTSDNEAEDGKRSVQLFFSALGGKIRVLKGRGHYILRHMGTEEFPELLEEFQGMGE